MAATTKNDHIAQARQWAAAHLTDEPNVETAQHLALTFNAASGEVPSNPQTLLLGLEAYVANVIWNFTADTDEAQRLLTEFGEGVAHQMSMLYMTEAPETPFQAAVPQRIEDMIDEGYFGGDRLEDLVAQALLHRTDDQLTVSERELYEEKILPVLKARFENPKDWKRVYRQLRTAA
jgi:hypothetical protein